MNNTVVTLIILAILAVGGIWAYHYWNQPRPLGQRMSDSIDQLNQGNLGKAADALGNETNGEQIKSNIQSMVSTTL